MLKRLMVISILSLVLIGCGGSSDSDDCSIPDQNQTWFSYLQDWYYWYQDLPASINPQAYSSIQAMLDDVKSDLDRFSYVITREEYDAFFSSGSYFGYGFSSNTTQYEDSYVIRYVFSGSGAEAAGLSRGDRLTVINGYTVTEIKNNNIDNATVYGPDEEGYTIEITYINTQGQTITTNMVKGTVNTNTVFHTEVFNTTAGNVGYLSFQHGFIEPSSAELQTAFSTLQAGNPSQLILDLRYNGGGRISVAALLGSLIGGNTTNGELMATLQYNDKHQDSNSTYTFSDQANKLNINRVIVLTTGSTCSASEMIINGIDPFIEVVTIGTATCGKPIGMSPQEYCSMVMSAINFKVVNSEGYGDYFDGIASSCTVNDQIVAGWGSSSDPITAEAIYYAENASCSAAANKTFEPYIAPENRATFKELLFENRY